MRKLPGRHGASILVELIAAFRIEAPDCLPQIEALTTTCKGTELALLAPSFAGNSAHLGALRLPSLALEIEQIANPSAGDERSGKVPTPPQAWTHFREAWDQLPPHPHAGPAELKPSG